MRRSSRSFPYLLVVIGLVTILANPAPAQTPSSPFPLLPGQQVAWSKPTNGQVAIQCPPTYGQVTVNNTTASISMYQASSLGPDVCEADWTGFTPVNVPAEATVDGIYAVGQVTSSGSGAYQVLTFDSTNPIYWGTYNWGYGGYGTGGKSLNGEIPSAELQNYVYEQTGAPFTTGQIPGSTLSASLDQTLNSSGFDEQFNIGYIGYAVYYTPPPTTQFAVLDPYLLSGYATGVIPASVVASNVSNSSAVAKGMIADGTSTGILVFQTNIPRADPATLAKFMNLPLNAWSDNAVTNSPAVNKLVLCVLEANSNSNYFLTANYSAPEANLNDGVHANGQQLTPRRFLAEGGLRIVSSPPTYFLAQKNEVKLDLRCHDVDLSVRQMAPDPANGGTLTYIEGSDKPLSIRWDEQGNALAEIVPLRIGSEELHFTALCPDGGVALATTAISVEAPFEPPSRVFISSTGAASKDRTAVLLSLDGTNGSDKQGLELFAVYPGVEDPIPVGAANTHFRITTPEGRSIVALDAATGTLTPRRVGYAVVSAEYAGKKDSACVAVRKQYEGSFGGLNDICCKLLSR